MRKIVVCCNSFPPEKGGAPTRIYNMALLLRDAGYEVTVITAMPNYPTGKIFPEYRGKLLQKEIVDGIQVIRLWLVPSNSGNLLMRGLSLTTFLWSVLLGAVGRLIFGKTDLVIVSSPPLISAWLYALLASWGRKKLLVNISDIWPLTATEMGALRKGMIFGILQRMERSLYKKAHAFSGQSNEIIAHIADLYPSVKPAFLYRNLQQKKASVASEFSSQRSLRIIYAGNLGHAQGMLALCTAINFSALKATLDIYGDGAERAAIAAYIHLHPEYGIHLHNMLLQSSLDALLPDYDVVLIPLKMNIHGAVPSKLFMAVAAGLPVLFCGGGEGAALVEQHQLGWPVAPGHYEVLAQVIIRAKQASEEDLNNLKEKINLARDTIFSKELQDCRFTEFIHQLIDSDH